MKFHFKLFLIFVFTTCLVKNANANTQCLSTFNISSDHRSNQTSAFLAYLGNIIEEDILSLDDLKQFKLNLENGVFENPIHTSAADINPLHSIHHQVLNELIHEQMIDRNRVLSWLEKVFSELEAQEKNFSQSITKTKSRLFQPMIFNPIELHENKHVAVMATPVTQYHWSKTMGVNPSHFKNGDSTETIVIDGKEITLQPNHPVENITLYSAMVFANELSVKEGLTPYYEFIYYHRAMDFEFLHRSLASKGVLDPNSSVEFVENDGDGYRLPTASERERLYQILARTFVEKYKNMLLFRAWLKENSDNKTHEVAKLKPFRIESNLFYDFIGNVEEWAIPFYGRKNETRKRITREESNYTILKSFMHSKDKEEGVFVRTDRQYPFVGFRLLRNITPPKEKEKHR